MTVDVLVEKVDDHVRIVLNRPDRANSFDDTMRRSILDGLEHAGGSGAVATVLTGAGSVFCAGGHLGEIATATTADIRSLYFGSLELFEAIRNHPLPVIAAVNGPAVGGGFELVAACDLAVCSSAAWFSMNSVRLGSAPVLGGTGVLALCLGEKRAREAAMLGRRYTAEAAAAQGWVNDVVAPEDLDGTVSALVAELALASPRSLEIAKISSNVWWNATRHNLVASLEMLVRSFSSGDLREGAAAHAERRTPDFGREARR